MRAWLAAKLAELSFIKALSDKRTIKDTHHTIHKVIKPLKRNGGLWTYGALWSAIDDYGALLTMEGNG